MKKKQEKWKCPNAKGALLMFLALVVLFLVVGWCQKARAQTKPNYKLTTAQGWAVVMDGEKWDALGSSTRLGIAICFKLNQNWGISIEPAVGIPMNAPHFKPRFGIGAGVKIHPKIVFAFGIGYELHIPYGKKKLRNDIGIGFGPMFKIGDNVVVGLITAPGIIIEDRIWKWLFQPKISFLF